MPPGGQARGGQSALEPVRACAFRLFGRASLGGGASAFLCRPTERPTRRQSEGRLRGERAPSPANRGKPAQYHGTARSLQRAQQRTAHFGVEVEAGRYLLMSHDLTVLHQGHVESFVYIQLKVLCKAFLERSRPGLHLGASSHRIRHGLPRIQRATCRIGSFKLQSFV